MINRVSNRDPQLVDTAVRGSRSTGKSSSRARVIAPTLQLSVDEGDTGLSMT